MIGSNIRAQGETDPMFWAVEIRATQGRRGDITKPIWQCSLRNSVHDRVLRDDEWADACQTFIESMGLEDNRWSLVCHGDDPVHIVVSRVNDEEQVWHGRSDRGQAQTACTQLDKTYGLEACPTVEAHTETDRDPGVVTVRKQAQDIRNKRAGVPHRPGVAPTVGSPHALRWLQRSPPKRGSRTRSGDPSYRDHQRRTSREQRPAQGRGETSPDKYVQVSVSY
ncbi:relaxase/mobilization nuclease domain-containing protein [Brevibacterium sp. HMSC063G07]|uniref:relaxase/mobilization nuclease domain-containing protein n=1 Tax=Brevibacterium sp. HMSC063G07 TaxID=1739261 RepID=UPI0026C96212